MVVWFIDMFSKALINIFYYDLDVYIKHNVYNLVF